MLARARLAFGRVFAWASGDPAGTEDDRGILGEELDLPSSIKPEVGEENEGVAGRLAGGVGVFSLVGMAF